jgi:hypothetical protein
MGVSFVVENLSTLLPEATPQKSISFKMEIVGRFATNSPVLLTIPCECRSGRMAIEIIGGSELATPTQAKVMIFGLAPSSRQVTRTTGVTKRALVGFTLFLVILPPSFIQYLPLKKSKLKRSRYTLAGWTRIYRRSLFLARPFLGNWIV